jgi:UDP-2,4-diacetamido-2,4,6-trideoxy-beta-L-altropyranose hydrolase
MRCLSLADTLREAGVDVSFICRDLEGSIAGQIEARGYPVHLLPKPVDTSRSALADGSYDWLGVSVQQDANETLAVIGKSGGTDWLVVDHYGLDSTWERELRPVARHIMVIDDLANRDHDCDLLLDQNLYEDASRRYRERVTAQCRQLLGPRYALLRRDFAEARERQPTRTGQVKRLLVFFGSYDPLNYTAIALQGLRLLDSSLHVDIVSGSRNPHLAEISNSCRELPNATLHCDTPNISSLMAQADLAIGAGGSTTWERACMGLPSVVLTLAENQRELTATLAERGVIISLDAAQGFTPGLFADTVRTLVATPALLRHLSGASRLLVDGRGAHRVRREMLSSPLQLRRAKAEDGPNLLAWRNSDWVRSHSHDQAVISTHAHERWLVDTLGSNSRILLIAETDQKAVGVLRYDIDNENAVVSIYLVAGNSGQGYGSRILLAGDQWLARERPDVKQLRAEVLPDNVTSIHAFSQAGYEYARHVYQKRLRA